MTALRILRAAPLTTLQDAGRFGYLRHGISASGPMDRAAFQRAEAWLGGAGSTAIEFTTGGLSLRVEGGSIGAACDGGEFTLSLNGEKLEWPARMSLKDGDVIDIAPGPAGNYGYFRTSHEVDVPLLLGSRATNLVSRLGGLQGRGLRAGDLIPVGSRVQRRMSMHPRPAMPAKGPIRVIWGLHADLFSDDVREHFISEPFVISHRIDRMGARLEDRAGVFTAAEILSLVSDAVVPGDIQILGDGTPIVLMRDHQPTGGYPRIATVVDADLDRLAQMRPGSEVSFRPVTLAQAYALLKAGHA
ncbi:MAG: biotin-dependent carboxyltransferase family protein [Devosia sp.]|nr:biotin-dependent carboxyltransferase family protein [Devosia sp.]